MTSYFTIASPNRRRVGTNVVTVIDAVLEKASVATWSTRCHTDLLTSTTANNQHKTERVCVLFIFDKFVCDNGLFVCIFPLPLHSLLLLLIRPIPMPLGRPRLSRCRLVDSSGFTTGVILRTIHSLQPPPIRWRPWPNGRAACCSSRATSTRRRSVGFSPPTLRCTRRSR